MPIRTFTISATSPASILNMMHALSPQLLRLKFYSISLDTTTYDYDIINFQIGNCIGSDYTIDNDIGVYRFKLALDNRYIDATTKIQTTFTSCDIPLNMAGPLDQSFEFKAFDQNNVIIPTGDVVRLFLQFECSE